VGARGGIGFGNGRLPSMSARKPHARNNHLEQAMALLIRNQAAFVEQIAGTIESVLHIGNGNTTLTVGSIRRKIGSARLRVGNARLRVGSARLRVGNARLRVGSARLRGGSARLRGGSGRLRKDSSRLSNGLRK